MIKRLRNFVLGVAAGLCWALPAVAQSVTPTSGAGDVGTQISGSSTFTVTGGSQQLNTLFHSFEDFSPATSNVLFELNNSQSSVEYVVGRVTGNNLSFIDGQLELTGGNSPDLFLINPNGITFDSKASLALPGSFISSTAESVLFNNSVDFSAIAPDGSPLLTVSAPTGLQFGSADSAVPTIEVINNGHSIVDNGFAPVVGGGADVGLRIGAQETIALIGHNVNLSGGVVSNTAGGQLHLGSIHSGKVTLDENATDWRFDYSTASTWGNIALTDRAIVDASGLQVGLIDISAHDLTLEGGAMILALNYGTQVAPDIRIDALGDVSVNGLDSNAQLATRILSTALNSGRSSNINIQSNNVATRKGGAIISSNYGSGSGGAVTVDAEELIQIVGTAQENPTFFSSIGSATFGSGDAGDLDVESKRLNIADGNALSSAVLFTSTGTSGSVRVRASESIEIGGFNNENSLNNDNSIISSSTLGNGNAEDVRIDTARLTLRDAGLIGSYTSAGGSAGDVVINATQEIHIDGGNPEAAVQLTTVGSAGVIGSEAFQLLFGLTAFPTGDAGNTQVKTPILSITDGGELSVKNEGAGESGTVIVNADRIYLDAGGNITAQTNIGDGGSIDLNVDDVLLIRRGSLINTASQSIGDGGNISIAVPVIIGLENSDIVADAVRGNGGNINITTQSIFGLEFRDQRTAENDITASSEFGLSGTVEVNNLAVNSSLALVELPSAPADTDDQIATACASDSENQFIASGQGGLSVSPTDSLSGGRLWHDTRSPLLDSPHNSEVIASQLSPGAIKAELENSIPELVEVSGWQLNQDGHVELLAAALPTQNIAIQLASCLAQAVS